MSDREAVISTIAPLTSTEVCENDPLPVNDSADIVDSPTNLRQVIESKPGNEFSERDALYNKHSYSIQLGSYDGGQYCTTFPSIPNITLSNHSASRLPLQQNGFGIPASRQNQNIVLQDRTPHDHFHGFVPETWEDSMSNIPQRCDGNGSRNLSRGRTTYSVDQITELEKLFTRNAYPTPQSRQELARNIRVPEGKVKIWFQNRRARAKKQRMLSSNSWRVGLQQTAFAPLPVRQEQSNNNNNSIVNEAGAAKNPAINLSSQVVPNWEYPQGGPSQNQEGASHTSLSLSCLSLRNQAKHNSLPSTTDSAAKNSAEHPPTLPLCPDNSFKFYTGSWRDVSKYERTDFEHNEAFPSRFPVINNSQSHIDRSTARFSNVASSMSPSMQSPWFQHGGYSAPAAMSSPPSAEGTGLSIATVESLSAPVANDKGAATSLVTPAPHCEQHSRNKLPNDANSTGYYKGAYDLKVISSGYKANVLSGRYSPYLSPPTSTALLRSPPPIRRFVFPFKNLMETSRNSVAPVGPNNVHENVDLTTRTNCAKNFMTLNTHTTSEAGPHFCPRQSSHCFVDSKVGSQPIDVNMATNPNLRTLAPTFNLKPYQMQKNDFDTAACGTSLSKQQRFNWQMNSDRWQHINQWNSTSSMQKYQPQATFTSNAMHCRERGMPGQMWPHHQQGYGNSKNCNVANWPRMYPNNGSHVIETETRCPSNGSEESGSSADAQKRETAQGVWSVSELIPGTQPPSSAPMVG
uniref:Homeobox domain-containing protein n=1 Tax=Ciona intestinalis TaxID=7719 RepID=F6ZQ96_CIOIN|nr:transcription factor protein isoform X1 [Ciona intestinalis]|eukprot:XP_026693627.1 transcription factor protein isoform X1 [Ciona intestinalis]